MNTPKQLSNYVKEYFLSKIGSNTLNGHMFVDVGDAYDLGSASKPFRAVYATSLVGVGGSTDELVAVESGATPGYLNSVLDVGSNLTKNIASGILTVSLIKTPLWTDGTTALTGNLSVNSGITIDGVDISVFKSDYDAHVINVNAHHNKQHDIVDATNHTVTGAQYSVIGLPTTNNLGVLATTTDGSLNFNAILRSSAAGNLKLASLTSAMLDSSSTITMSPTTDIILSPNNRVVLSTDKRFEIGGAGFASGFAGYGGRFDYNVSRTSAATLEVDDLYVRGRMNVYELVIQQIRATNGNVFVTDSAKISAVTFISGTTYELTVDGNTNDYQPFAVGDILRAQRVNLGSGIQVWQSNLQVSSISPGSDVKKFRATLVSGNTPTAGMEFVRLGNASNSSRQGTIYLASADSNAPFIDILDGVTSHATFNTSGTIKTRLGKLTGISDSAFTMSGYGLYSTNAYLKGIVSIANDALRLDSSGIRIKSPAGAFVDYGAYKFVDSDNNLIGGLYGAEITQLGPSYTNSMILKTNPSLYGSWLTVHAQSGTGANQDAYLWLSVGGGNSDPVSKSVSIQFKSPGGASGDAYIQFGEIYQETNYIRSYLEYRASKPIRPNSDLGTTLGTASFRWSTLYVDQIIATTISGTTMNGAEWEYAGSMIIDANSASNTVLSIVNQGAGSVDVSMERDLTVGRDIIVTGLVDGIDIASFYSGYTSHTSNVNGHHNRDHVLATTAGLSGTTHTVSGLTTGQVLKATSSTDAAFAQLAHSELSGLTTGDPHCFSSDTELLTKRGFVNYKEITKDDEALTMNLSSGQMEYQNIESVHIYDNFTELISIKNKKMDILVTPEHEMVYSHDRKNYHKKMAKDILNYKRINVPVSGFTESQPVNISDDFLTLLGLIISEGHFYDPKRYGYGIKIYQRLSSSKFIEEILNKCEVVYTKHTRTTTKSNEPMIEFYIVSSYARTHIRNWITEKRVPDLLMNLSGNQFWAFLKGLIYGDGSVRGKTELERTSLIDNIRENMMNHTASYYYASSDKILSDQIVQLCAINGVRAYQYFSKGGFKDGAWRINLTYTQDVGVDPKTQHKLVPYSGDVWCVVVPNHTLVVRRNGIVFIAGNTQYVHLSNARTITAVHTINPTVAGAWITLGANATGQLITGLNADLLDGYDSSAFPRKAENATITGEWTVNNHLNLGGTYIFKMGSVIGDKIWLYSNTYGIGVEASTLTQWSNSAFRFRVGGTSVTTGTQAMHLNASGLKIGTTGSATQALDVSGNIINTGFVTVGTNLTVTNILYAGAASDTLHEIGNGKIGFITGVAGEFAISQYGKATASDYMIKQTSSGNTMVNAPTAGYVDLRINNSSKFKVDGTTATSLVNVDITGTLVASSNITATSGVITASSNVDTVHILGRGRFGFLTGVADEFAISHFDKGDASNYMIKQTAGGNVMVNSGSANYVDLRSNNSSVLKIETSIVTLAASKTIRTATFDSSFPISGFQFNETAGNQYALTIGVITADELHVKTFVADEVRIDRGDEWWGKGYGVVETSFTTPALVGDVGVEVWFENAPSVAGAIFSNADWVFFRTLETDTGLTINNIWGQVYSSSSGAVGGYLLEQTPTNAKNRQRWRFVLRSGPTSTPVTAGVTGINFGASGQAIIRLSTIDSAGAPYIKFGRWSGANPYTPANHSNEVIIGKLTAVSGPVGSIGIYSTIGGSEFEISDGGARFKNIPIEAYNGANQTLNISSNGTDFWIGVNSGDKRLTWNGTTLAITGTITANLGVIGGWTIATGLLSSTGIGLDSTNSKFYIGASTTYGTDGIQLERNGGNPRAYIGDGASKYFKFDGTNISWSSPNTTLDTSGNLTAVNATLAGNITAESGDIGGWSISVTDLVATNIALRAGAANIARIAVGTETTVNTAGINSAASGTDIAMWAGATHANRATAPFRVELNGGLFASDANITGAITANTGSLVNLSVTGKLTMSGVSSAIAIGTTPPTSATAGTGIWIDRTGYYGLSSGTYQVKIDATNGKFYAGSGNILLDTNGLTIQMADAASYMRHGTTGSEVARYYGSTDLVGQGSGYWEVKSRSLNESFNGVAELKLTASNSSWVEQASIGVYKDIYTNYAFSTAKMLIGSETAFADTLSQVMIQQSHTSSSISLNHTSWGRAAMIGFNAHRSVISTNYTADNEWKFAGVQDGSTKAGMFSFDGNSNIFRFHVSGNNAANGGNITGWTKVLEVGLSSGSPAIGFLGTSQVAKQTVTGSRGGNAALASLLTALANYGLITNSTTA